jgi:hypothetical protein
MGWKKGQSGNPKGRPKTGNSLTDAIRRKVDPDFLTDKLLDILERSPSEQTKLRAIELLSERGWKKPAQVLEVGPSDPYEDLSDDELAQLKAEKQAILMGTGAVAYLPDAPSTYEDDAEVVESVSYDSNHGSEARAPSSGAEVRECRTTSHVVGAAPTQHPGVLRRKP